MIKIKTTANLLIPVLLIFAGLYVYFTAIEDVRFAFETRSDWYTSPWVHPTSPAPNWQRGLYVLLWMLPIAFGLFAVGQGLFCLRQVRQGVLFDALVARSIRLIGLGTVGSGLADFFGNLITPQVMSLTNPDGMVPFRWYFDSEPAGLILCGGGFYLIGWILAEARKLADENEGFI